MVNIFYINVCKVPVNKCSRLVGRDMKTIERIKQIVQVAQLYYEYGHTQQTIAKMLGISRPTVSRLLTQSIEQGIVQITIHNPLGYCSKLEEVFRKEFGLKEVIISPSTGDNPLEVMAEVTANYLHRILQDRDTIGVAWGKSLQSVSQTLRPKNLTGIRVVQMKGGMGLSGTNIHASQIVERFSTTFRGKAFFLPVPAIVDSYNVKNAFLTDSSLKKTIEVTEEINVAIFSIGALDIHSAQIEAGYLTVQEVYALQAAGAVGDISSRFFTIDGQIADQELDKRTIGLELAQLKEVDYAIAVATGKEKATGILGALRGGYLNVLITDEETANLVLDLAGINHPA